MEKQQFGGRAVRPSGAAGIETRVVKVVNPAENIFCFRRFQLFPDARLLLRDGRPIEIGSRAFDLLTTLFASRGSVVTKEEIFRRVWPSTTVVEGNLRYQMTSLRKVLGEDSDVIQTIPGMGYLFVCEPDEAGAGARESMRLASGPSARDLSNPASCSRRPPPADEPSVVVTDNDQHSLEAIDRLLRSVGPRVDSFASV